MCFAECLWHFDWESSALNFPTDRYGFQSINWPTLLYKWLVSKVFLLYVILVECYLAANLFVGGILHTIGRLQQIRCFLMINAREVPVILFWVWDQGGVEENEPFDLDECVFMTSLLYSNVVKTSKNVKLCWSYWYFAGPYLCLSDYHPNLVSFWLTELPRCTLSQMNVVNRFCDDTWPINHTNEIENIKKRVEFEVLNKKFTGFCNPESLWVTTQPVPPRILYIQYLDIPNFGMFGNQTSTIRSSLWKGS